MNDPWNHADFKFFRRQHLAVGASELCCVWHYLSWTIMKRSGNIRRHSSVIIIILIIIIIIISSSLAAAAAAAAA